MCYKLSRLKMLHDLLKLKGIEFHASTIKELAKGYDHIYGELEEDWEEMLKESRE